MSFPRAVRERILKRCSEGKPVVVVPRNGKPSRVFSLESYVKTVQTASRVKPWIHRYASIGVNYTNTIQDGFSRSRWKSNWTPPNCSIRKRTAGGSCC